MKNLINRLFQRLQNMNLAMCSYRDAWQVQALRAAEVQNMNDHEARRAKRPSDHAAIFSGNYYRA